MLNTSWRFFIRAVVQHRAYTALNVLGLAVGLAVTLLVTLYLKTELSYDSHYPDSDRIYRLTSQFYFENEQNHYAWTGLGLAPLLAEESDAIEGFVRIGRAGDNVLLKTSTQAFYEDEIFYADTSYFDLFPANFIQGDPKSAFNSENNIILTQSLAHTLFGAEDPMGGVIRTNNNRFRVSGVIEDLPQNSHIRFKALLPAFIQEIPRDKLIESLWAASTYTYIKLKPNRNVNEVEAAFQIIHDEHMVTIGRAINSDYDIKPEELTSVHYSSTADYDLPKGKTSYLYVISGVGMLILFLAMINYINLSTARASGRAKEIGMRKVLGSTRRDLIWQLVIESVLLTFIALFISIIIAEIITQTSIFEQLIQKDLSLNVLADPWLIYGGIVVTILVGVFSGIYPALYLSKIPVAKALKGSFKTGSRSMKLRSFLVGTQFTISISVVVLTLLMAGQMEFMGDRYLGFNKEDIILVPVQDTSLQGDIPQLLEQIQSQRSVVSATIAQNTPGGVIGRTLMSNMANENAKREAVDFMHVGYNYFETMEMEFVEGGDFRLDKHTDSTTSVVVNEKLVEFYGFEEAIGSKLHWGIKDGQGLPMYAEIVGVIKDVNVSSLHSEVKPMVFFNFDRKEGMGTLHIRVESENLKGALAQIETVWNEYNVGRPFEFSFLDKTLAELYAEDRRQTRLISTFTLITILISSLGLLGLTSYTTQQRFKEIGVRKVLGASAKQIVSLLFKDVAILVTVAVIVSIPLSYIVYQSWVSNFAYLAPMHWSIFFITGIFAVTIAYAMVSLHSLKAAKTNPVHSLKYE